MVLRYIRDAGRRAGFSESAKKIESTAIAKYVSRRSIALRKQPTRPDGERARNSNVPRCCRAQTDGGGSNFLYSVADYATLAYARLTK